MRAWIRQTAAEMELLRGRLLDIVLLALLVCSAIGCVTAYAVGSRSATLAFGLGIPALLIAFWLSRRRAALAVVLIVAFMQSAVTSISYAGFGINDTISILYLLTILVASLLLPRALYLGFMAVVVGNAILLVHVELTGRYVFMQPMVDPGMLITVPVMLLAVALIARVITENLRHSLVRARIKTGSLERAETEQRRLVAELEDKNAELERFARVVSDDLKGPLSTIRGLLDSLEKDALGDDIDRIASGVQRVNQAAAEIQERLGELHHRSIRPGNRKG